MIEQTKQLVESRYTISGGYQADARVRTTPHICLVPNIRYSVTYQMLVFVVLVYCVFFKIYKYLFR